MGVYELITAAIICPTRSSAGARVARLGSMRQPVTPGGTDGHDALLLRLLRQGHDAGRNRAVRGKRWKRSRQTTLRELTDEDLEADHVEEMARMLCEMEEADGEPEFVPVCKKMRFDLCLACYRKFVNDPLGRENASKFDFSPN